MHFADSPRMGNSYGIDWLGHRLTHLLRVPLGPRRKWARVVKSLTGFFLCRNWDTGYSGQGTCPAPADSYGGIRDRRETVRIYSAMMERSGILA